MIRSSRASLKYTNKGKLSELEVFRIKYRDAMVQCVDLLWGRKLIDIPKLLPREFTDQIKSELSARMIQCACKQASGIVRGTITKQHKRAAQIKIFISKGEFKKARKLQKTYDKTKVSKPNIQNVQPELDSRFVTIDLDNETSFDGWLTIGSMGNHSKIEIPFKLTKHLNEMFKLGKLKPGIRVGKKDITFMFNIPNPVLKNEGTVLGIDVGKITLVSCSNDYQSVPNIHDHDLNTILDKMSRQKPGSKAFKRSQEHRKNYINWSINQIDLTGIKQLNLESIKNINFGKNTSRVLKRWTCRIIFDKLVRYSFEHGVRVHWVVPTYTSQRCSFCGWTRKRNRNGKIFKCGQCGFTIDSDLNASRNIALPLIPISDQQRRKRPNIKGFYWNAFEQELIVPAVQETCNI